MNDNMSLSAGGVKKDEGKNRYDLLAPEFLDGTARILTLGVSKYAERNWEKGMRWGRVFASLMRHLWAWWGGESKDSESGESHLLHASCCLMFLVAYEKRKIGEDDRPLSKKLKALVDYESPDPRGASAYMKIEPQVLGQSVLEDMHYLKKQEELNKLIDKATGIKGIQGIQGIQGIPDGWIRADEFIQRNSGAAMVGKRCFIFPNSFVPWSIIPVETVQEEKMFLSRASGVFGGVIEKHSNGLWVVKDEYIDTRSFYQPTELWVSPQLSV